MKKLLPVALVLFAAQAYALPPVVPKKFSGMAEVRTGTDSACQGMAPFDFVATTKHEFRIVLTAPPCFRAALKYASDFQVQPTGLGTLWVITLRGAVDPGNDDGPLLHLQPGDPADQAAMAWGPREIARYSVRGTWLDRTHFQLAFRNVR